jgi:hypothetical protein
VRFEWRRDGQFGLGISVQDVDQLILLDRGDQTSSSFGISGEILAGNDPTNARLAECLEVKTGESVLGRDVFDDRYATGICR